LWQLRFKAIINRNEVRGLLAKYNQDVGLRLGRQNVHVWCRVLAKVAHAYTVAECGINSFKPYLLDIILERPVVSAFHWVGGDENIPAREPHLHTTSLSSFPLRGKRVLGVRLRLFAYLGGPVYWIIVGETQGTQD
jgi:hypothetical protein